MMRKTGCFILFIFIFLYSNGQEKGSALNGIITGLVISDSTGKALENASVVLNNSASGSAYTQITGKEGAFEFTGLPEGWYRLVISNTGFNQLVLDSIHVRPDRYDFNLNELKLKFSSSSVMQEVVIYAEKPLIESKDGNITFNAGESALSASSSASELLTNVPLVTKDPDGKILVRGKEPKILIDDKPVELNLQQLQDLLESMPGSSVEKIEVLTNPPPQYANESGGVINIVTKKGKVGVSGRLSFYTGTRGDKAVSGYFSYRKKGLSITISSGAGYNRYAGNGYSVRNNIYADSSNYFNTTNNYVNKSIRPSFRANIDYDISKNQSLNLVLNYSQNNYDNFNTTEYRNINRFGDIYRLSERSISSEGASYSPSLSLTYLLRQKTGGSLRIITGNSFSISDNDRDYYQQFFNPDHSPNGIDSTQQQNNRTTVAGHNFRVIYSRPLANRKTFFSLGSYYNRSNNHVDIDASYLKKPEGSFEKLDQLSNNFWFHQSVSNLMTSVKQLIGTNFSVTAGLSAENTAIWFQLLKDNKEVRNSYTTLLPFGNINKSWKEKLNLTLAYRRTIRRPGISQLNPTIDFSDPYNVRFGNEKLEASTSDNFDLIVGRTKKNYFANLGLGYNIVRDVFSQVRTLLPDGKTQITWENISGRKEYEISSWNGYTFDKKIRVNLSASYTFNQYSDFDKKVRKFRDGGSFTSNFSSHFSPSPSMTFTGSFNLNRFGNPQGYATWSTSMNLGIQRKFFNRKLYVTVNAIDPFRQQQIRRYTYGSNFNLESYSSTRTRSYRLNLSYVFVKTAKKTVRNPVPLLK